MTRARVGGSSCDHESHTFGTASSPGSCAGVLPAITVITIFVTTTQDDAVAFDFRVFYAAAEAALRGETIYPPVDDPTLLNGRAYVYPPLVAVLVAPFTLLSDGGGGHRRHGAAGPRRTRDPALWSASRLALRGARSRSGLP